MGGMAPKEACPTRIPFDCVADCFQQVPNEAQGAGKDASLRSNCMHDPLPAFSDSKIGRMGKSPLTTQPKMKYS
jgi:hypothetical protein